MKIQNGNHQYVDRVPIERLVNIENRALLVEQLIEASIDCIVAVDKALQVIYWNKAAERIADIAAGDVINRPIEQLFTDEPHRAAALINALEQTITHGYQIYLPVEKKVWFQGYFELHCVPLTDTAHNITGALIIAHDVAHRVKSEARLNELNLRLEQQYKELERATEELASFTRITSQDLKEPLRNIYSRLERIIMDDGNKISAKSRAAIRKIQATAQRLGLMADTLTTFSEIAPELCDPVALDNVVNEVLDRLKQQLDATEAIVTSGRLPVVQGNYKQLVVLLYQVISNSLKFFTGTRLRITINAEGPVSDISPAATQGANYWLVTIEDNGPGIPVHARERVFLLFEKGDPAKNLPGAGVGLALARKIARSHGGDLFMNRETTTGCKISWLIPARGVA